MGFGKFISNLSIPGLAYNQYRKERAHVKGREKSNKQKAEKFQKNQKDTYMKFLKQDRKDYEKHIAQARKDQAKYAKQAVRPFPGLKGKKAKAMEKPYYGAIKKGLKGKHIKYERMDKQQRKLLDELAHKTRKDIEHMPDVKKIQKPSESPYYKAGGESLMRTLRGGPDEDFQKYKQATMSEFSNEILPAISERFAGAGTGGVNSSAYKNTMADAAKMLAEHMSGQQGAFRGQHEQTQYNARGQAMEYAKTPLAEAAALREMAQGGVPQSMAADRYMQAYIPPVIPGLPSMPQPFSAPGYNRPAPYQDAPPQFSQARPGALHTFLGNMMPALGAGIGTAVGGPIGGAIGAPIGQGISNMFGGGGGGGGSYQQPMAMNQRMPSLPDNFGMRGPAFNPQYSMRYPGL